MCLHTFIFQINFSTFHANEKWSGFATTKRKIFLWRFLHRRSFSLARARWRRLSALKESSTEKADVMEWQFCPSLLATPVSMRKVLYDFYRSILGVTCTSENIVRCDKLAVGTEQVNPRARRSNKCSNECYLGSEQLQAEWAVSYTCKKLHRTREDFDE